MNFIKKKFRLFVPKKIIIISEKNITNLSLGIFLQYLFLFFIIIGAGFSLSLIYKNQYYLNVIFSAKSDVQEINRKLDLANLKSQNLLKEKEDVMLKMSKLENNLEEIDFYLNNIGVHNQLSAIYSNKVKKNLDSKNFANKKISSNAKMNPTVSKVYLKTVNRRIFIEKIMDKIGIDLNYLATYDKKFSQIINSLSSSRSNQGGEFIEAKEKLLEESDDIATVEPRNLREEITYVSELEKILHHLPISQPMFQYYISSNFGIRNDPVKNLKAFHSGLDMAGGVKEKVYSTASGTVVTARKYGSYGRMIEIDHGFGFKTRYGHLSKILVKKGERIFKGQNIGIQGSSGRSTGPHLHYEIRYKDKAVNPLKFLNAGKNVHKS